ncbi:hypothetical protein FACS1894201_07600 [Bacteroidia bacterium]|nr:hypothetical protein FACS1894201_07600 [Bacteroidia bacterium]
MKKLLSFVTGLTLILTINTSCSNKSPLEGFKVDENGSLYQVHVENKKAPLAQEGDVFYGEIWVRLDTALQFTNAGTPDGLFTLHPSERKTEFWMKGAMRMHEGDSATFAYSIDTLMHYSPNMNMQNMEGIKYVYYTLKAHSFYSEEVFMTMKETEKQVKESAEAQILNTYVQEQHITVQPNDDGVYVVIHKRGTGAKITDKQRVSIHYTGKLLDGTIFDTSLEDIAKASDLYNAERDYTPLEFVAGSSQVIRGMDNAILNMRVGTKATLIIPSAVGYGQQAVGNIPSFSTLVFDIEIVAAK